jgi:hypothetical protein
VSHSVSKTTWVKAKTPSQLFTPSEQEGGACPSVRDSRESPRSKTPRLSADSAVNVELWSGNNRPG